MSVRVTGISVVVRRADIEAKYRGGIPQYGADAPAPLSVDDHLVALCFDAPSDVTRCCERLDRCGIVSSDVAVLDTRDGFAAAPAWLEYDPESGECWPAGQARGTAAEPAPFERFSILSTSSSGLNYVRERKGGMMRVLTESELADFSDPPPCPQCAEQFGCEHRNCAGEPLLSERELETVVPAEWIRLARDYGVSLGDLDRLRAIERGDTGYRPRPDATTDMRMLELVLLLNET